MAKFSEDAIPLPQEASHPERGDVIICATTTHASEVATEETHAIPIMSAGLSPEDVATLLVLRG